MLRNTHAVIRPLFTLAVMAVAAVFASVIWLHYETAPWTRDGQVLAYVVNMAPEVSGRVAVLKVADNQSVRRGDLLYGIDRTDFALAVARAQSTVKSTYSNMQNTQTQSERRHSLTTLSTSVEEKQTFKNNADMAVESYAAAVVQLSQATVNLERTQVLSPVNGVVTNLQLQEGDYATAGTRNISVIDRDSFWIVGYFEETKIANIGLGERAAAALMGYRDPVIGHVESIASGIDTPNTAPGSLGLASVNPVFTWVRLAQRIPVRIHIDKVPPSVRLAIGMTATVTVGAQAGPQSSHGFVSRVLTQVGN